VERIKEIAATYGMRVIYDACHTFGVTLNDEPILNYDDMSVMSFHATKVFTTFEGGAIVCHDEATVVAPGINTKMNEFQAALGLF